MVTAADYLRLPYGRVVVPEDDGTFRAEIVEFPGCLATAETAAEALASLERVAEGWLESMIARTQHVPEPMDTGGFSGKFVVRLPKSLHRRAAYAAAKDGVSLNQLISNAVAEHVGLLARPTIYLPGPTVTSLSVQHFRGGAMASLGFSGGVAPSQVASTSSSPVPIHLGCDHAPA